MQTCELKGNKLMDAMETAKSWLLTRQIVHLVESQPTDQPQEQDQDQTTTKMSRSVGLV